MKRYTRTFKMTFKKLRKIYCERNIINILKNPEKIQELSTLYKRTFRAIRVGIGWGMIDYNTERQQMAPRLASLFGIDQEQIEKYLNDLKKDAEFQQKYGKRWNSLEQEVENLKLEKSIQEQVLYLICRILQPNIIVETGVQYGKYTSHILKALSDNQNGKLFCIDLPQMPSNHEIGYLIPDYLRDRWELKIGDSRNLLPPLLKELGQIDIFWHDSLHTQEHMTWEYETAESYIKEQGALVSHDIVINSAFQNFLRERELNWTQVVSVGITWPVS